MEMRGVVSVANAVTDWRSYIRNRPWVAIGIAFSAGFWLAPRRSVPPKIIIQPTPSETPNTLAAPVTVKAARVPWMRWIFNTVGPIAMRAAQGYALTYVENLLINNPPGPKSGGIPPANSSGTGTPRDRAGSNRRA